MMAWVSFGEMLLENAGTEEGDKSIPAFLISSDFTKSSARSAMFIGCQDRQSPFLFFSGAAEWCRWDHVSGRAAEKQRV